MFFLVENLRLWKRGHIRTTSRNFHYVLVVAILHSNCRLGYHCTIDHDGFFDHLWNDQSRNVLRVDSEKPELPAKFQILSLVDVVVGNRWLFNGHVVD